MRILGIGKDMKRKKRRRRREAFDSLCTIWHSERDTNGTERVLSEIPEASECIHIGDHGNISVLLACYVEYVFLVGSGGTADGVYFASCVTDRCPAPLV